MNNIITCKGRKYNAKDEYFYNLAMELEDTGTALNNPRLELIIYNFDHFEIINDTPKKHYNTNTIELLHSFAQEMRRCRLSDEDEDYLDDILGNDPMCMF